MQRDELLRGNGYWTAKIQIDLYNQLIDYMKINKLNRTQLAKNLGVTKSYISQILNGDFNHRISKLVELSLAIGKVPKIEYEDLEQFIKEDEIGYTTIKWKLKLSNNTLPLIGSIIEISNETSRVEQTPLKWEPRLNKPSLAKYY